MLQLPLQQTLARLLIVIGLISIVTGLNGCSTISHQDKYTIENTQKVSLQLTRLLMTIEERGKKEPECRYENFSEDYKDIRVNLHTSLLREQAKPKNDETSKMVAKLSDSVQQLADLHGDGCLSMGELEVARDGINSKIRYLFKVEQAKTQPLF